MQGGSHKNVTNPILKLYYSRVGNINIVTAVPVWLLLRSRNVQVIRDER